VSSDTRQSRAAASDRLKQAGRLLDLLMDGPRDRG